MKKRWVLRNLGSVYYLYIILLLVEIMQIIHIYRLNCLINTHGLLYLIFVFFRVIYLYAIWYKRVGTWLKLKHIVRQSHTAYFSSWHLPAWCTKFYLRITFQSLSLNIRKLSKSSLSKVEELKGQNENDEDADCGISR